MATTNVNIIWTVTMVHMPAVTEDYRQVCAENPAMESLAMLLWTVERIRTCFAARITSVEVPRRCAQLITVHLAGLRRLLGLWSFVSCWE